jgi:hypothetical protein
MRGDDVELCGETVKHQVFGAGQIVDLSDGYITVLFEESKLKKKFAYPSAFGTHLELENELIMTRIKTDKTEIELRKAAEKRISDELAKYSNPLKANLNGGRRPRKAIVVSPVESDL